MDAIRQTQDVRLSRRAARAAAAGARGASIDLGLAGRLFGVPGFVAHRNLSRSAARGRTVVASLAVSSALIVVTGSLALALEPVSDRAGSVNGAGSGADVTVSARADAQRYERFGSLSDHGDELDRFLEQAKRVEGVEFVGSTRQGQAQVVLPADMISPEGRAARERVDAQNGSPSPAPSFGADGAYYGAAALFYLDDASWRALVDELGLDAAAYTDSAVPRAIGLNVFNGAFSDGTYVSTRPFARTGTAELYVVRELEGFSLISLREGADGEAEAVFINQSGATDVVKALPASEAAAMRTLEVGALADDEPAALNAAGGSFQFPCLILPESAAAAAAGAGDENPFSYFNAAFSFKAADHARAAEELETLAAGYDDIVLNVNDVAEGARQNRLQMQAIELFVLCFSVITVLIAVANAFNTLANGIILRTREFAVLRSAGMGGRAFARMLAYECASYALRGLALGLAAATAATWLLHEATARSFAGVPFTLPWAHVGAAVAVVLAVLALSVAYALRRGTAGRSRVRDAPLTDGPAPRPHPPRRPRAW